MKPKLLILSLAIPIATLGGMTIYNEYMSRRYLEFILPIKGYDPRDLLSGNYLRFRTTYESPEKCPKDLTAKAFMCLKPKQQLTLKEPADCEAWITGECRYDGFNDGLERFYIPQDKASKIESLVRDGKAEIVVSVGKGSAIIKDLLINGKSWKEY